ncbi:MAG: DUF2158 domain-containing protein [Bacteroidia bacterium]
MENEFEIGETVRLISGGPLMTVNEYNEEKDLVDCIWFNIDENICTATFKGAVLILDDDDFDMDDFDFDEDDDDDEDEEDEWEKEVDEEEEK